jgi:hypothetical protein
MLLDSVLVIVLPGLLEEGATVKPLFAPRQPTIVLLLACRAHAVLAVMRVLLEGVGPVEEAVQAEAERAPSGGRLAHVVVGVVHVVRCEPVGDYLPLQIRWKAVEELPLSTGVKEVVRHHPLELRGELVEDLHCWREYGWLKTTFSYGNLKRNPGPDLDA